MSLQDYTAVVGGEIIMKKVNDINLDEERGEESMERKIATTMKGQSRITTIGVPLVFIALFLLSYTCGLLMPGTAQATVAITDCAGCHGYTSLFTDGTARNNPPGAFNGSHSKHVVSAAKTCVVCHTVPATETSAAFNHANGLISVRSGLNGLAGANYATSSGANYASAGNITVRNNPTLRYCYNTYCHSTGTSASNGTLAANNSPVWGNNTLGCNGCHGAGTTTGAPNYADNSPKQNDHDSPSHKAQPCSTCHFATTSSGNTITGPSNHTNGAYNVVPNTAAANFQYTYNNNGGTCANGTCHGSAQWGVTTFDCVTCHSSTIVASVGPAIGQTRRAVSTEFTNTWSHKRGGSANVTKFDCSVCHMEGDVATGAPNGNAHGNGYVELRDPDTGAIIQLVTAPASNTSAAYTSVAGSNARFGKFSRNLGSSTIEPEVAATMINQCLKCHDANGATSTAAQVPGANAYRPFNTAVRYGATNTVYAGGNVINISGHFTTTNRSYHPILGRQNNWYAKNRLVAAWNGATRSSAANTTSYGLLLSCWDCHATPNASGSINSTVTAHGAANINRGEVWRTGAVTSTNNTTLCIICHVTYNTTTTSHHGTGSALASSTNSGMTLYMRYACYYCHSSDAADPGRPIKSADAHGYSTMGAGNAFAVASSGYGFIRGTGFYTQGYTQSPIRVGGTAYSAQCSGYNDTNGTTACSRNSMGTYTPGGVY